MFGFDRSDSVGFGTLFMRVSILERLSHSVAIVTREKKLLDVSKNRTH